MSPELGRNDPCHCGSKKKYKKCHLEKDLQSDRKIREKAALNAAKVAAEEGEKKKNEPSAPPVQKAQRPNWMNKFAKNVGFLKPFSRRQGPRGDKGG